jgi:predicted secreted hydrolase
MTITVYRTRTTHNPATAHVPEYWQVELLTHTEDGVQIEFFGEFFTLADANAMAAAWRNHETRPIVWLCASLARPAWHYNQGEEK